MILFSVSLLVDTGTYRFQNAVQRTSMACHLLAAGALVPARALPSL